ncbi:MAG: hypothetical protein L3J35_04720 [Bacteroidales bacterium]|nr:hypothetical protein [Bacteroidales bacterium]
MNTYKIYLIFLFIMLLNVFAPQNTVAQCNDTLVKQAIFESGHDAVFLKEYKVKFKKGKANRPVRVAKYSTFLKDSTTYRFNVVNAKEYSGQLILQLYKKDKLLGSTYDLEGLKYNKSFDFECEETDTYQILMSFIEGKAGCAAAILSMVVNDSTNVKETQFPEKLYVGIENPLYIAYIDEPNCSVHVFSNQGTVEGQNGKYTVIPDTIGTIKITAQTIDSTGNIKGEISKEFIVEKMPIPYAGLNGNTGGLIYKSDLLNINELDLHLGNIPNPEKYKIINFTVSNKLLGISGKMSNNCKFTYSQKEVIKGLKEGEQLFIKNIKVKMADNKIIELKPLGFIIY